MEHAYIINGLVCCPVAKVAGVYEREAAVIKLHADCILRQVNAASCRTDSW